MVSRVFTFNWFGHAMVLTGFSVLFEGACFLPAYLFLLEPDRVLDAALDSGLP